MGMSPHGEIAFPMVANTATEFRLVNLEVGSNRIPPRSISPAGEQCDVFDMSGSLEKRPLTFRQSITNNSK